MSRWGVLLTACLAMTWVAPPTQAGTTIASLPQTNAADFTPRVVNDGVVSDAGVYELRQVGGVMYAGGDFNTVLSANRATSFTRRNLFSFNPVTGAVSSWAPVANGAVWTIEPTADGRYLFIGGDFNTFDGQSVRRLVKYDLQLNRVDPTFQFPVNVARVSDLQLVGSRLFVSGTWAGGLVAVDPVTGARTSYFDGVQAAGAESRWSTRVYRFAINPAGNRMVILGSFQTIGGQARQQAAMLVLGAGSATVSGWYSSRWNFDCFDSLQWYTRDVDWMPDGSAFAIAGTGGGFPGSTRLCDTASLWSNSDLPNQEPRWVNFTGGDTIHSVQATNRAIIVAGHFRWLDNPLGRDSAGAGAVSRQGIGAIDPVSGRALAWNPTKSIEGGRGGYDLLFTSQGLWIAHFEERITRELHEGLGLLPF